MYGKSPDKTARLGYFGWIASGITTALIVVGAVVVFVFVLPNRGEETPPPDPGAAQTAAAYTPGPPAGWSLTFTDDFSANQNGWPEDTLSQDFGSIGWLIDAGRYRWTAHPVSEASWWAWSEAVEGQADFYYSAVVTQIEGSGGDAAYGLLYRWVDDDSFYVFIITGEGYCSAHLNDDGEWRELLPWRATDAIHPGEANRLTVSAEGADMEFLINDFPVGYASDGTISEGALGLYLTIYEGGQDTVVEFDSIEVYAP
ncbi:MAG: hypothetical protein JXJ17_06815 [Anaerolineae bacterium]|nr:hypothetical protein [Anaerolineae bacterium]